MAFLRSAFCILTSALFVNTARAVEPPTIPVGLDAYRQWDQWPLQRVGQRTYMRSTYDRRGGNEGADASHFLYQLADDQNVTLDLEGAGVLAFARYNHWHGSPWHYTVDGADELVRETSTDDPNHPVANSVLQPSHAFPQPLAFTWSATKGADLSWVPIEFEKSFRMSYARTHYGTGYYIFNRYVPGTPFSHPLKSWSAQTVPSPDVVELIGRSGTDIAPRTATAEDSGKLDLPHGKTMLLREVIFDHGSGVSIPGPGCIRALKLDIPKGQVVDGVRLRITFDHRPEPSVDAPLPLFFGSGTLYNRDGRECLVKAFPVNVRCGPESVSLACYFPMPFSKSAKVELVNDGDDCRDIHWAIRVQGIDQPLNQLAYFHATYRDHPTPERGKDLVLLDTKETEGGGNWSGSFVGTSFIFSHNAFLGTLEGDPRFFFDDSQTPQGQGTGTEEWGGGGDYWGGRNMTLPFAGHPCGAPSAKEAKCDDDKIESAYRFLLADLFPFGRNAKICLEHGATNESNEHYETVTYWYGLPAPSLVKTDTLQIGDVASEKSHQYSSPAAAAPYEITSRYEWGVDHLPAAHAGAERSGTPRSVAPDRSEADEEIYPATTDTGRSTTGTSEFTMKLDKENLGVLLRRKLDYQFPNQRVEVFIANPNEKELDWKPAGVWYLAGSNTCVYSNPKEELGPAQHIVQTSNRRFRDDEFLIARHLTRGRDAIRVRTKFTPVNTPLFPGQALPPLAWSEIRYDAYCFVMPKFEVP